MITLLLVMLKYLTQPIATLGLFKYIVTSHNCNMAESFCDLHMFTNVCVRIGSRAVQEKDMHLPGRSDSCAS